jgi:hypothetical protein
MVFLACLSPRLEADVDVSEYQLKEAVRSPQESERLQKEFMLQRIEEASKASHAEADLARRYAEEEARRAARPWPVRLTETRCTQCHADEHYRAVAHALPGWIAVALRMRFFNMAPLDWAEIWIISRHLAERQRADGVTVLLEWSAAAGMIFAVPIVMFVYSRKNRRTPRAGKKEP